MIQELLQKQNLTKYRLAKSSGIPYTTVNDICAGRAQLEKCSAETVYKLSKALGVSMESLLEPRMVKRINFELFKSNLCHRVKELGDIDFIIETLEENNIRSYYNKTWYPESLYTLAMLDYISRVNNVPLCEDYEDLRRCKLQEPIYPAGILSMSSAVKSDYIKEQAMKNAIPEFLKFNIIESEIRNVV